MKNVKRNSMLLAIVAVVIGLISHVNAGVVADCTLTKYNAMGSGWGGATDYSMVGSYTGFTPSYTVLKFDISGLTEQVDPVYLKVDTYIGDGMGGMFGVASAENPLTVSARAVSSDVSTWDSLQESDIDTTAVGSLVISDDGYYYFDVTSIVNAWISSGNNYGLALAVDECTSGNSFSYLYGIGNSAGDAPVLTTVPEPATLALLGLGSLIYFRKK